MSHDQQWVDIAKKRDRFRADAEGLLVSGWTDTKVLAARMAVLRISFDEIIQAERRIAEGAA